MRVGEEGRAYRVDELLKFSITNITSQLEMKTKKGGKDERKRHVIRVLKDVMEKKRSDSKGRRDAENLH